MVPAGPDSLAGRVAAAGVGELVARRGLFERLSGPAQVAVVSAPAGSGKTVLLRSWIDQAGLDESAGWVATRPDERDPRRFWFAVLSALRATAPGSALAQALAELGEQARERGEIRISLAMLRLAQHDPLAASAALTPVLDQSAPLIWPTSLAQAFLLEAIARDTLAPATWDCSPRDASNRHRGSPGWCD